MSSNSPLGEVWKVYEVTKDCLKVTARILRSGGERFVRRTGFVGRTLAEVEEWIKNSRDEIDRSVIVLLWAHFEIIIVSFVQTEVKKLLKAEPKASAKKLLDKNGSDIERWKKDDVLDLLKDMLKDKM